MMREGTFVYIYIYMFDILKFRMLGRYMEIKE